VVVQQPLKNISIDDAIYSTQTNCCTGSYYYVAGWRHPVYPTRIYGAQVKIKTRYGKLCGQGIEATPTHACAYVSIEQNYGLGGIWFAQVGYIKMRRDGDTSYFYGKYFEVDGTDWFRMEDSICADLSCANIPQQGETHSYMIYLDKNTGSWSAYYDNANFYSYLVYDDIWTIGGNRTQCSGEIYSKESDIPGTQGDPCVFSEYEVDTLGLFGPDFISAGLEDSTLGTSDTCEWGYKYINSSEFEIWDKKPLP